MVRRSHLILLFVALVVSLNSSADCAEMFAEKFAGTWPITSVSPGASAPDGHLPSPKANYRGHANFYSDILGTLWADVHDELGQYMCSVEASKLPGYLSKSDYAEYVWPITPHAKSAGAIWMGTNKRVWEYVLEGTYWVNLKTFEILPADPKHYN